jgi:hypothetical protein
VIAKANIDMTALPQGGTRDATAVQTSDQPQQPFSESLLAASKASPEANSASDSSAKTARRLRSDSGDAKAPSAVPDNSSVLSPALSQQTVPTQQVMLAQQTQLIDPKAATAQAPLDNVPDASSSIASQLASIQSTIAPSGKSSSQTASTLSGAEIQGVQAPIVPSSQTGEIATNTDANDALSTTPNGVQGSPSSTAPNAGTNAAASADHNGFASAAQSPVPAAAPEAATNSVSSAAQVPLLHAALDASTKAALAATLNSTSTNRTLPPAATSSDQTIPASGLTSPDATANQFVVATQQIGERAGTAQLSGSSPNALSVGKSSAMAATSSKNETKSTANDATESKQHAQTASAQQGSQATSQSATTSGDQNQGGASAQGQDAAPVQMNLANHSVAAIAQAQSTATGSPAPSASSLPGVTPSAAKASDNTASASVPTPQAPPVINTAKLIQNMGQTEMRVGMRSNEFGNISINTSTSRDAITAQISLDHGELAKTLAAHLPEMQARLGVNQPMDVRINMYGAGTGQNTGTSGGTTNSSADQSQSGRQQSGSAASSYAGNSVVERQLSPALAAATSYSGLDARLDIRV